MTGLHSPGAGWVQRGVGHCVSGYTITARAPYEKYASETQAASWPAALLTGEGTYVCVCGDYNVWEIWTQQTALEPLSFTHSDTKRSFPYRK